MAKEQNVLKLKKAELGYTDMQLCSLTGLSRPTVVACLDISPKVTLAAFTSVLYALQLDLNVIPIKVDEDTEENKEK